MPLVKICRYPKRGERSHQKQRTAVHAMNAASRGCPMQPVQKHRDYAQPSAQWASKQKARACRSPPVPSAEQFDRHTVDAKSVRAVRKPGNDWSQRKYPPTVMKFYLLPSFGVVDCAVLCRISGLPWLPGPRLATRSARAAHVSHAENAKPRRTRAAPEVGALPPGSVSRS